MGTPETPSSSEKISHTARVSRLFFHAVFPDYVKIVVDICMVDAEVRACNQISSMHLEQGTLFPIIKVNF